MSTIERAIAIATEAHAGECDQAGEPYIYHPLRVMFSVDTIEERIAAVLHDVVEDSPWSLERLRAEGFSEEVVVAVDSLTRREGETYEDFITRAGRNPIGRRVKLADLVDNCDLRRIAAPTPDDLSRVENYRRAIEQLGGQSVSPAPSAFAMHEMKLVWPSREYLPGYVAALERGWSPDNLRGRVAAQEELARIAEDADAFIASLVDREAAGTLITLPDGTTVPRLPGYRRWLWDGEFCGSIGLRWQRGTEALPPHCLGHIGYAVVPWKQRLGYATRALREMLREAKAEGLRFVEITTDPDNVASRRVVEANGGVLVEEFVTPSSLGRERKCRYRVQLHDGA